ncbi:telomere ends associated isoform X2 [Haematobia irritans]|uniref:telomere ends associated isoform X2 n=1 Tax=Haematobia irritans TaxID=7368 RepID=UPI003F50250D
MTSPSTTRKIKRTAQNRNEGQHQQIPMPPKRRKTSDDNVQEKCISNTANTDVVPSIEGRDSAGQQIQENSETVQKVKKESIRFQHIYDNAHICPVTQMQFREYTNIDELVKKLCKKLYGDPNKNSSNYLKRFYIFYYLMPCHRKSYPLSELKILPTCPKYIKERILEIPKWEPTSGKSTTTKKDGQPAEKNKQISQHNNNNIEQTNNTNLPTDNHLQQENKYIKQNACKATKASIVSPDVDEHSKEVSTNNNVPFKYVPGDDKPSLSANRSLLKPISARINPSKENNQQRLGSSTEDCTPSIVHHPESNLKEKTTVKVQILENILLPSSVPVKSPQMLNKSLTIKNTCRSCNLTLEEFIKESNVTTILGKANNDEYDDCVFNIYKRFLNDDATLLQFNPPLSVEYSLCQKICQYKDFCTECWVKMANTKPITRAIAPDNSDNVQNMQKEGNRLNDNICDQLNDDIAAKENSGEKLVTIPSAQDLQRDEAMETEDLEVFHTKAKKSKPDASSVTSHNQFSQQLQRCDEITENEIPHTISTQSENINKDPQNENMVIESDMPAVIEINQITPALQEKKETPKRDTIISPKRSMELGVHTGNSEISSNQIESFESILDNIYKNKSLYMQFKEVLLKKIDEKICESDKVSLPVSLTLFKKLSFYNEPLKKLLSDFCGKNEDLKNFLEQDHELYNGLLSMYYRKYFTSAKFRHKYSLRIKQCPNSIREKMLKIYHPPPASDNTQPIERDDSQLPNIRDNPMRDEVSKNNPRGMDSNLENKKIVQRSPKAKANEQQNEKANATSTVGEVQSQSLLSSETKQIPIRQYPQNGEKHNVVEGISNPQNRLAQAQEGQSVGIVQLSCVLDTKASKKMFEHGNTILNDEQNRNIKSPERRRTRTLSTGQSPKIPREQNIPKGEKIIVLEDNQNIQKSTLPVLQTQGNISKDVQQSQRKLDSKAIDKKSETENSIASSTSINKQVDNQKSTNLSSGPVQEIPQTQNAENEITEANIQKLNEKQPSDKVVQESLEQRNLDTQQKPASIAQNKKSEKSNLDDVQKHQNSKSTPERRRTRSLSIVHAQEVVNNPNIACGGKPSREEDNRRPRTRRLSALQTQGKLDEKQAKESKEKAQRLEQTKAIIFQHFPKNFSMPYMLRTSFGIKQKITQAILNLDLASFKEITHVYNGSEIYDDATDLKHIYNYVIKSPKIWPRNIFIKVQDICNLMKQTGLGFTENTRQSFFQHISPRFFHWSDLRLYTDIGQIVIDNYWKENYQKLANDNEILFQKACNDYYNQCWMQDKWLERVPKLNENHIEIVPLLENNNNTSEWFSTKFTRVTENPRDQLQETTRQQQQQHSISSEPKKRKSPIKSCSIQTARKSSAIFSETKTDQRNNNKEIPSPLKQATPSAFVLNQDNYFTIVHTNIAPATEEPLLKTKGASQILPTKDLPILNNNATTSSFSGKNVSLNVIAQVPTALNMDVTNFEDQCNAVQPMDIIEIENTSSSETTTFGEQQIDLLTKDAEITQSLGDPLQDFMDSQATILEPNDANNSNDSVILVNSPAVVKEENAKEKLLRNCRFELDEDDNIHCSSFSDEVVVIDQSLDMVADVENLPPSQIDFGDNDDDHGHVPQAPLTIQSNARPASADLMSSGNSSSILNLGQRLPSFCDDIQSQDQPSPAMDAVQFIQLFDVNMASSGSRSLPSLPDTPEVANDHVATKSLESRQNTREMTSSENNLNMLLSSSEDHSLQGTPENNVQQLPSSLEVQLPSMQAIMPNNTQSLPSALESKKEDHIIQSEPRPLENILPFLLSSSEDHSIQRSFENNLQSLPSSLEVHISSTIQTMMGNNTQLLSSVTMEPTLGDHLIQSLQGSSENNLQLLLASDEDHVLQGTMENNLQIIPCTLEVDLPSMQTMMGENNMQMLSSDLESMSNDHIIQNAQRFPSTFDDMPIMQESTKSKIFFKIAENPKKKKKEKPPPSSDKAGRKTKSTKTDYVPQLVHPLPALPLLLVKNKKPGESVRPLKDKPIDVELRSERISCSQELVIPDDIKSTDHPTSENVSRSPEIVPQEDFNPGPTSTQSENQQPEDFVASLPTVNKPNSLRVSQELSSDKTLFNNTSLLRVVDHNYHMTPEEAPNNTEPQNTIPITESSIAKVTKAISNPPIIALPKSPVIIKKKNFIYRSLLEFHYFQRLTAEHVAKYKLPTTNYGLPYLEATISCGRLKTKISNEPLSSLFPQLSSTLHRDILTILHDLKEFHYSRFKRSYTTDLRHNILHEFMFNASPFARVQLIHEEHNSEYSKCKSLWKSCDCSSITRKPFQSLTLAIKPKILTKIKNMKKEL